MSNINFDFGINNKNFIITGASGNIGTAIAELLCLQGANIYGFDIVPPTNTKVFKDFYIGNATNESDVSSFSTKMNTKEVQGVICCTGTIGEIVDAENISILNFNSCMDASVLSSVLFIKYFSEDFKSRKSGSFLLFSSTAGLKGNALQASYTAAKHAIIGLVRSFSRELGPWGIRVNAILPGLIESEMARNIEFSLKSRREKAILTNKLDPTAINNIPLRRIGLPSDIAQAALFFIK